MTTTKERLFEFLNYKNIKPAVFERRCSLSNGFISKMKDNITDGSCLLISRGFPELNLEWLRFGEGEMLNEPKLEISNAADESSNMVAMVRMMQEFIVLGKKNADANLINAEANKLNAVNLERLISLIESKLD